MQCCIVLLGLSACFCRAADPQVEALLAKLRAIYSSVDSASIETVSLFHTTPNIGISMKIEKFHLKVYYRKPDKIDVDERLIGGPRKLSIRFDRDHETIQTPKGPQVAPAGFQTLVNELRCNLETLCFWDWQRQLSTDTGMNMHDSTFRILHDVPWKGKRWLVLEETAAGEVCSYYLDPKTLLMWRTYVRNLATRREMQDDQIISLQINKGLKA